MITVDVELHPKGDARNRMVLARLSIWNDLSGTEQLGNYKYEIAPVIGILGVGKSTVRRGAVIAHDRSEGSLVLLARVLEDAGF